MASSLPDVAEDLLLLASVKPALASLVIVSGSRNAYSGPERPSKGSGIPLESTFWEVAGGRADLHNDGRLRVVEVQCLVRGKRQDYDASRLKATAILDNLDLNGPFTGASSGRQYIDVVAVNATPIPLGPGESDAEYFAVNFNVTLEG